MVDNQHVVGHYFNSYNMTNKAHANNNKVQRPDQGACKSIDPNICVEEEKLEKHQTGGLLAYREDCWLTGSINRP